MVMKREIEWGVVPLFQLEADTKSSLVAACTIALSAHYEAEGFDVREANDLEPPTLIIEWARPKNKFLTPINTPEALADLIWNWLQDEGRYDNAVDHDTDGDTKKGYKISNSSGKYGDWYTMLSITPEYIIYGK